MSSAWSGLDERFSRQGAVHTQYTGMRRWCALPGTLTRPHALARALPCQGSVAEPSLCSSPTRLCARGVVGNCRKSRSGPRGARLWKRQIVALRSRGRPSPCVATHNREMEALKLVHAAEPLLLRLHRRRRNVAPRRQRGDAGTLHTHGLRCGQAEVLDQRERRGLASDELCVLAVERVEEDVPVLRKHALEVGPVGEVCVVEDGEGHLVSDLGVRLQVRRSALLAVEDHHGTCGLGAREIAHELRQKHAAVTVEPTHTGRHLAQRGRGAIQGQKFDAGDAEAVQRVHKGRQAAKAALLDDVLDTSQPRSSEHSEDLCGPHVRE
mmetsp:Transcript_12283/g.32131  ORF Transcript_12283/g.32131 Transcript_12283/m.32131 type:complete len:324 (+) Transcript_12283:317-1288(+)